MKRKFTKYPVSASRSTPASLGQYSKWYRFASDADLEELGYTEEDVDMSYLLADYDMEYVGTAIVREDIPEEVIDRLADEGYDLLTVGRQYDTNEIILLMAIGESLNSVTVEDIKWVLSW